jgi:hypothetical protein
MLYAYDIYFISLSDYFVSSRDHAASNCKVINKQLISKDIEGSGRALDSSITPVHE